MNDKKKPVKTILILSANPIGTTPLRLDEEVRDIKEGMQRSRYRDQFEVKHRLALRIRDLRRALLDHEPQILHFTGHGESEGILVEDKQGLATLITSRALTGTFKLYTHRIECVILSACYSDHQAVAINKHIRYVVGMPGQIKDKAAIEFAVGFYDALGAGKPVEEAFDFGCNAIQQYWPEIPEYIYPKLHINKRIRIEKKRHSLAPALIAFMLLAAFFIGLQWKTKSDRAVTTDTGSEKALTTQTESPHREVSQPASSTDDDPWVYITRTGSKYHRDGCMYLKSKFPIRLSEAKARGLTPCSVCKPP